MKDRVKFLIISIAVMIIVIITGTFAWLTYRSNKTAMVLTIGDINQAMVTLKPYQINANIVPNTTFTENKSVAVNVEAVNNTSVNKKVRLYYKINEIDEEDFRYKITRKTDTENSFTDYKNGDFSGAINGQDYEILNEEVPEGKTYDYKVYVWLNGANSENNQGSSFNGELRAEINTNYMKADVGASNASAVVFDSGILRSSIETVIFQNSIPTNLTDADQPIDVSLSENNSVIAYFKDADGNSKYEMYIAANGMIVPSNFEKFFNFYTSLVRVENANYLDTSQVESMRALFQNCLKLQYVDVGSWDTSNVVDMSYMFNVCKQLNNINLSSFDTSNVSNMSFMFNACTSLTELDVSNFNTSNVTNMSYMFASNSSDGNMQLQSIVGIEDFDTSNVTNMLAMFQRCNMLTSLNLSGWNVSNVTNVGSMFQYCGSLTNLNLNGWDTSKMTNMSYMFRGCRSLTTLNLASFDTSKVTDMSAMFFYCSSLTSLDLSNFDTSNVTNMSSMLEKTIITDLSSLSSFDTSKVTDMRLFLSGNTHITTLSGLENWDVSNVTNWYYSNEGGGGAFERLTNLSDASAINNWNISPSGNYTYMFKDTPVHPTFTRVSGTWDSNGTFTPSS